MFDSKKYWEQRYLNNGNSGLGSYGDEADFKSKYINLIIKDKEIKSINDFGCGDGNQISLLNNFESYVGFDVSKTILQKNKFKFGNNKKYSFVFDVKEMKETDLVMSIDVIYHIIEDKLYNEHIDNLFSLSNKYVLVYGVNTEDTNTVPHMKYRKFVDDVSEKYPEFKLIDETKYDKKNNNIGFYLFEKQ
jgi:SAM-dependent methyltransferase